MNFLFYAPQMAAYGGMERHICSLAIAAAQRGHRVTLLTTSNSLGEDLRKEIAHPQITLRELPVARGGAGKLRKLLWLAAQIRALRGQSWDVIYTNGQSALARTVWFAAKGRQARCIHHHHTSADAGEQVSWSPAFLRVLRAAPELVGCSQATSAALNAATGRTDAHFLPYLTRCPVDAARVAERPPGPQLHFGFMGRLVAEKGIDAICRFSEDPQLADITWHFHGSSAQYPPEFFQRWPKVIYHGAYRGTEAQARALLSLDAITLFSTHNEGMPLSLIEAMSAGLPWIATDRGGTREIAVSPANAVIVPHPFDDDALKAGLRTLGARIRAGQTSRLVQRRGYDEHFSPEVVSRRWLAYFERGAAKP